MASQGPNSAGAGANNNLIGSAPWLNPGNITSSNNSKATTSLTGMAGSNYLVASSFGFSIPAGSTIDGIVVEWERSDPSGVTVDDAVRIVKGGSIGATDRAAGPAWPTSDAYASYGSSSDTWGEVWTPADINSATFGAALAANAGSPASPGVDHCRITVYYTAPVSQVTSQQSQRWDPLPDLTNYWQQRRTQPVPTTHLPPPPLINPQRSQRHDPLPDFTDHWRQRYDWPVPVEYIPTPPPTRQPKQQLYHDLPDHWQQWTAYRTFFRVFPPPQPAPSRQPSQRWDALPVLDYLWWEQFRKFPLPSYVLVGEDGYAGVVSEVSGLQQWGGFRVQNDIAGYCVFVGAGVMPDLSAAPAAFSDTLPMTVPAPPPGSGSLTYHVLVVSQDHYGLRSQNQQYTTITVASDGSEVMPPVTDPQDLTLRAMSGRRIRVLATYPARGADTDPADFWRVWVDDAPPSAPDAELPASDLLAATVGPLALGDHTVRVALYRSADGSLSDVLSGTITVTPAPDQVEPVPGGYN